MYYWSVVVAVVVAAGKESAAQINSNPDPVDLKSIQHAAIDLNTITTSGFSSGASMANMQHFMFSRIYKCAGAFAGGPFNLVYNASSRDFLPMYALNAAITALPGIGRSTADLVKLAESLSTQGLIDPISNIRGSKSFVFQGTFDPIILLGSSEKLIDMYKYFGSTVEKLSLFSTHCIPTDNYGSYCAIIDPFHGCINNCGVQSIFKMFKHFFGTNYIAPRSSTTQLTGKLYNFYQSPFTLSGNAGTEFMNDDGGIYIPKACEDPNATCKLHVAFHGCFQTVYSNTIGDLFATQTGYLQIADANKIIMLFPRAAVFGVENQDKVNLGCWDWMGFTTSKPALKELPQVKTVTNILNFIIGSNLFK